MDIPFDILIARLAEAGWLWRHAEVSARDGSGALWHVELTRNNSALYGSAIRACPQAALLAAVRAALQQSEHGT